VSDRPTATNGHKSTGQLFKEVTEDLSTLVRKEIELAKIELTESVTAKVKGAAIFAVVGVMGLFVLLFLMITIRDVVNNVAPSWGTAWLGDVVVVALLIIISVIAALVAKKKIATPIAADLTKKTIKDDVEWAKNVTKK
jgi:uncharacterized membrane protein YqjE